MTALAHIWLGRPRRTLGVWSLIVVVLGFLSTGVEERLQSPTFVVAGTESYRAGAMQDRHFGSSVTLPILLEGPPEHVERQGRRLVGELLRERDFTVLSPWQRGSTGALTPSRRQAIVLLNARRTAPEALPTAAQLERVVDRSTAPPVRAHITGQAAIGRALQDASLKATKLAELIAMPVLVLLLLMVFRSPVAALLPAVLGGATVVAGFGMLAVIAQLVALDALATTFASMIGLALGVDYSLLIVSRFREERRGGAATGEAARAAAAAAATAGRTVTFAGLVLVAALITVLLLLPGGLMLSAAVGVITVCVFSVGSAVLVMPAALALLGPHVDRWPLPAWRGRRRGRSGGRVRQAALRKPGVVAGVVLVTLLAMAVPAHSLSPGTPSVSMLPSDSRARADFEAVSAAMGEGWGTPFELVLATEEGPIATSQRLRRLARFQERLARDPEVALVLGPGAVARETRALRALGGELHRARRGVRRSVQRLRSGLSRSNDGVRRVRSGLDGAADAARRLESGARRAAIGAARLERELARAAAGGASVGDGAARAATLSAELTRGLRSAEAGAARLERAQSRIDAGGDELAEGIGRARADVRERLAPGARELAERLTAGRRQLERLREPAQMAEQELRRAFRELQAMSVGKADPRYARALEAVGRASAAVTGRHPLSGATVRDGYGGLDAELAGAVAGLHGAAAGAGRVAGGVAQLLGGLDRLASGVAQLTDGLARAAAGDRRLAAGLRRLIREGERFHRGLVRLAGGALRLRDGTSALERGGSALAGGVRRLPEGTGRLAAGLAEGAERSAPLEQGLHALERGTSRDGRRLASLGADAQLDRSPRMLSSGYMTLAALDGSRKNDRAAAGLGLNLDRGGQAARILVVPRRDGNDPGTRALRDRLSTQTRALARSMGATSAVGGDGGEVADYRAAVLARLVLLIIVLSIVTTVLLIPIFRSIALPVLAVTLNLLTVGATFGLLTVLFEGSAPLGGPGYIDALALVGTFTVIFALSLDYQVFLISRVREGFERTGDTEGAIEYGLRHTAGVVTGAAAIMGTVFLAFAVADFAIVRQLGIGLAIAVFLDATVVRLVLLPAVMRLLGPLNWALPRRVARLLPIVDLEGRALTRPQETP